MQHGAVTRVQEAARPSTDLLDLSVSEPDAPEQPPPRYELSHPFDPAPHRERMRGWIAIGIVGLLAVVVLFVLVIVLFSPASIESLIRVLEIVFGPVVGLVGAVTGFYYGSGGQGERRS